MPRPITDIETAPPRTAGIVMPVLVGNSKITPIVPDTELETPPLPRDLPQWVKDAISVSAKTRDLITRLKPVAIRILTFWDHTMRSTLVAGRRLSVDPSGSYRLD